MNTNRHIFIDPDSNSKIEVIARKLRNRLVIMVAALSFAIVRANTALAAAA